MPVSNVALTPQHTTELARALMNDKQAAEFEAKKEVNFAISPGGIGRFRVNAFTQLGRTGIVLRVIQSEIPKFEELHLPAVLGELSMTKRGLVIMVGATGSGKSTTLAAMIGYRNENSHGHIVTIEDPVEYVHPHRNCIVTHREVGVDTESWEVALKNTLRQAPDVIMIGEIRDRETMEHAVAFAETGHLVPGDAARQQRQPGARPHHQLLPRGAPPATADGPVAEPEGGDLAAAGAVEGRKGRVAAVEMMINSPLVVGPDLQGRGRRDQGDHEEPRTRDADLRPDLFDLYESGQITLRGRAAQCRFGQRPAPEHQAQRQAPGRDLNAGLDHLEVMK